MTRLKIGPQRLPHGGTIDRTRPVSFRFNDKDYTGCSGDSLASALLANGVRTVARSFKFHRPRGLYSCGVEEPNGLLQLGEGAHAIPSARAPLIELIEGLQARSQAGWPSVDFDLARSLDVLAPLWAAGFYNKTFQWPSWHLYEPLIRRMAGLGKAPSARDPDRYQLQHQHCDVLIIGGGVAGLRAALDAGRLGKRVLLVEQDHCFGGQAAWNGATIDGSPASRWLKGSLLALNQLPEVRLLPRTTAVGCYDHQVVALLERSPMFGIGNSNQPNPAPPPRERFHIVRAGHTVLATGAIEQPLIFANNDRPGIMLAGAARQYLRRYGVAVGSRVLIATNNDSAYALARDLKAAGVSVLGVADTRHQPPPELRATLRALGIACFPGFMPIDTRGFGSLRQTVLGRLSADGSRIESRQSFPCDALAVSGGFNPTLHLYAQAGGKLTYDTASGALRPLKSLPSMEIQGAAGVQHAVGPRLSPVGDPKRQWVDLLHDVTVADLQLALRENYTSVEHVKRYTTVGMAADQGKTSAAATLQLLAKFRNIAVGELGHTTLRPPFTPVTLGAIAGREIGARFAPERRLPMHDWHLAQGALMHDFGEWRRPVVYLRPGETREQATSRETFAVRTAAALFDGSSLGKIEIHGPDALEFLDRFYINDLSTLKAHRVRYGLMLRESGHIFDDGTVVMLAPDRLLITTTSGNAARVALWLEEWHQCEWPQLRVAILPVTESWATVSLAGPEARAILSRLATDIDLSAAAFPHLALREGHLLSVPARIYRVSFTGELTYEINVPTDRGPEVWQALIAAGASDGLQTIGLDALLQLRLEKGFLHLGTETDGTTVPHDVGWGKVAASKRRDYIGKRSLTLPENLRPDRLQLIGLAAGAGSRFIVGSHLRVQGSSNATDGWITSAGTMTLTGEPIALAMLRGGRARIGADIEVYDRGTPALRTRVVNPLFFDPAGDRMNA